MADEAELFPVTTSQPPPAIAASLAANECSKKDKAADYPRNPHGQLLWESRPYPSKV
ncbi:hypothetical protein RP20_CCG022330 [Aedes albopictus]|nr:hypothetical protein RP20_CCG022330 [Aedes albopictus]